MGRIKKTEVIKIKFYIPLQCDIDSERYRNNCYLSQSISIKINDFNRTEGRGIRRCEFISGSRKSVECT